MYTDTEYVPPPEVLEMLALVKRCLAGNPEPRMAWCRGCNLERMHHLTLTIDSVGVKFVMACDICTTTNVCMYTTI